MSQNEINESNSRLIAALQSRIVILENDLRITNIELNHAKKVIEQKDARIETMKLMMEGYAIDLEKQFKNKK